MYSTARALTVVGGVFTNVVLELVLVRKARMVEGAAAACGGLLRVMAVLIWLQVVFPSLPRS